MVGCGGGVGGEGKRAWNRRELHMLTGVLGQVWM